MQSLQYFCYNGKSDLKRSMVIGLIYFGKRMSVNINIILRCINGETVPHKYSFLRMYIFGMKGEGYTASENWELLSYKVLQYAMLSVRSSFGKVWDLPLPHHKHLGLYSGYNLCSNAIKTLLLTIRLDNHKLWKISRLSHKNGSRLRLARVHSILISNCATNIRLTHWTRDAFMRR